MDFDFLSSNLQIAYPFHENYTVDRAGTPARIADLFANAIVRDRERVAERLGLVSLLVRAEQLQPSGSSSSSSSSSSGSPYEDARLALRWEDSATDVVLDQLDTDVEFQWLTYGSWGIASWYQQRKMLARFVVPLSSIIDDGAGNEMIVVGYDATLVAQTTELYLLHQSAIAGGPGKVQRVYWKRGDQVQLVADRGDELVLRAGFNMSIGTPEAAVDGDVFEAEEFTLSEGRPLTTLAIDAVPGAGRGKYLLCPGSQYLFTLNGAGPNSHGELQLRPVDCYWLERPLRSPILPVQPPVNGISGESSLRPNSLRVHNACLPCCSCDDYIRTYEHLRQIWERGKAVSARIFEMRDASIVLAGLYDQLTGQPGSPLTLALRPENKLAVTLSYFNTGDEAITDDIVWTLTFEGPGGMSYAFVTSSGIAKAGRALEQVDSVTTDDGEQITTTIDVPTNSQIFWVGLWSFDGVAGEEVTVSLAITGGASGGAAQSITFPE